MSNPDTVTALPGLLRVMRLRLAQDCPATADIAIPRFNALAALEWAELLAGILADRMPAAVVEIPRVPRFGEADAAGPDHGLAPGRPHP